MRTSFKRTHLLFTLFALLAFATAAAAADPGVAYPSASEVSDQKAGSILVYNIYTSAAAGGANHNTRINITNTSSSTQAYVHLFFVSADCGIADSYVCLTANQTATFLASDVDPGVKGYIVAIAVDRDFGCPLGFNFLIGDEHVKFPTGHTANLGAEAFAALYTGRAANCDSFIASLALDGQQYNQAPRALAADNIPSRADGNDTMLIVNRIGGSLSTGASTTGTLFGILYDDAENAASYSINGACQIMNSLSNAFPRTTPRFETFIPSGRTGWTKIYNQTADAGLLGAILNFNPNSGTQTTAFTGGRNLHKLTLATANTLTIPVFPPSC